VDLYDVFISHASEDKDSFVRELALRLQEENIQVWYDEFSLKLGDSLRRSIDIGLSRSRFGVVILSKNFFAKQWPQRELDGLVARETIHGHRIILPVWHEITREEICRYSPPLADIVAVSSSFGIDHVVTAIKEVVRPQGSPLIAARDRLIELGVNPPVVTDEWWLDVVEASNRQSSWGFALDREVWGRWAFPLPPDGDTPAERGERLAWTALQLRWEREAEAERITQITRPEEVLRFIASVPGLREKSMQFPMFLAAYAPQLTIPGFGGDFERVFDDALALSIEEHRGYTSGSGLTVSGRPPLCDEWIALRHPSFGACRAASIACTYVQGELGGPPTRYYPHFDYLIWFIADASGWLPEKTRAFLVEGVKSWTVWPWSEVGPMDERELGIEPYPEMGALAEALFDAETGPDFQPGDREKSDLLKRIEISVRLLNLNESPRVLFDRFLEQGFIKAYLEIRKERGRHK
jgi:hypothetical protein